MKPILQTYKIELNNEYDVSIILEYFDTDIDALTMNIKAYNKDAAINLYRGYFTHEFGVNLVYPEISATEI